MTPDEQKKIVKQSIKDRIKELSLAEYDGDIDAFIVVVLNNKVGLQLMKSYTQETIFAMNMGLDMAKEELLDLIKSNGQAMQHRE